MSNILIVEPDKQLSDIYYKALKYKGFDVAIAHTGQDAVTEADKSTPDLVILELNMAQHNGVEFLYEFRSYTDWQTIPVIVQSSISPSEFVATPGLWHELNVAAYLYKPQATLTQLMQTVNKFLDTAILSEQ